MILLFDENISYRIVKFLTSHFPECKHVSDVKLKDSKDFQIWDFAKEENYTIVTFDSDFYDLSMIKGFPPKIIWLRVGNILTKDLAQILIRRKTSIVNFNIASESKDLACLEIDTKQ